MSDRANERALWIQAEGSFATDATSGDSGATAIPVDAFDLSLPEDTHENIPHAIQSGRAREHKDTKGAPGAKLSFKIAVKGLAAQCATGVAASTNTADAWTLLLAAAMMTRGVTTGRVTTAVTTGIITAASGTYTQGDLVLLSPLVAAERGAWTSIRSASSPYTVSPTFESDPADVSILYGCEQFFPSVAGSMGASLTGVMRFGATTWVMVGGRPSKIRCLGTAKGVAIFEIEMVFSNWTRSARGSLPVHQPVTRGEIRMVNSVFRYNNTNYDISNFELDWGIQQVEALSIGTATGRSNIENTMLRPRLKVTPLYSNAFEDLAVNGTPHEAILMLGAGLTDATTVNSCAAYFGALQVESSAHIDDGGILRNEVSFKVCDPHYASDLGGSVLGHRFLFARA